MGRSRSTSSTPTFAALAISLSEAARPPRVGSRSTWTSAPVASIAATRPCSGAVSLSTAVPNSSPSRQLITATPWTPRSPLTRTTSPGHARAGWMSTPCCSSPIPAVLMNTRSPCPASTTLVSPVTSRTSAATAAAPRSVATRPMSASEVPSSRMNAVESTSGIAPDMARSLTVPLTARSPMLPRGRPAASPRTSPSRRPGARRRRGRRRSRPARRRPRHRRPAGRGARSARRTWRRRRRDP